jgi:hypothetical protein
MAAPVNAVGLLEKPAAAPLLAPPATEPSPFLRGELETRAEEIMLEAGELLRVRPHCAGAQPC